MTDLGVFSIRKKEERELNLETWVQILVAHLLACFLGRSVSSSFVNYNTQCQQWLKKFVSASRREIRKALGCHDLVFASDLLETVVGLLKQ